MNIAPCLTDLHVLELLLIDRNLLTDHLLALVTDLGLPGRDRRPLVIMTAVTVVEDLSPVAFLPDYLPAVSPPVATHILHCLLACGAVPVVLHLALDALHGHHLGLAALTGGGLVQGGESGEQGEREESGLIIIIIEVLSPRLYSTMYNITQCFVLLSSEKLTQLEIISVLISENVVGACSL